MLIDDIEVPPAVKSILKTCGYQDLYPPQEEAIRKGVLNGKNLVLSSPTASGKTLVAELTGLKHILENDGKILYLTPLRALASEKLDDFQKYTRIKKKTDIPVRATISTGDFDSSDPYLARYDIIVATNEKVDSLIRHRAHWIGDVTLVVADEIHLLQDPDRGPTLEVALTRLRHLNPSIQILALSATVSNGEEIAEWLDAELVSVNWRPVPLKEGVFTNNELYFNDGSSIKVPRQNNNDAINLAARTVKEGGQAMIFAETRKVAVSLAQKSSATIKDMLSKNEARSLALISDEILNAAERTRVSELLAYLVKNGVAFHHAGIHHSHRKTLENNYRKGLIKLIVATPTLAAGVNLPSRTVIINNYIRYEPGLGRMEIPVFEYKQMAGRAGRPKYDPYGEAVLVAKTFDEQEWLMNSYVLSGPERIWSKLAAERVLRSHTLATIASGFARSDEGLLEFFGKTFYAHQYGERVIRTPVGKVLRYLADNEMVKYGEKGLQATEFGRRVSELYIDPESAVIIKQGLFNRALVTADISYLHLICHTPDITPRLYPTRSELQELNMFLGDHKDELMLDVPDPAKNCIEYEALLGELKSVRVLDRWINEARENELLEYFKVEPGDLYRLVDSANWLLHATHELASLFKHRDLLAPLPELQIRVQTGIKPELLPLVRLEGVGRIRARSLFNARYTSIEALKHASVISLMNVPGVGARVAKKIKDQVGGLIKKEEMEALKEDKTEQRSLSEF